MDVLCYPQLAYDRGRREKRVKRASTKAATIPNRVPKNPTIRMDQMTSHSTSVSMS